MQIRIKSFGAARINFHYHTNLLAPNMTPHIIEISGSSHYTFRKSGCQPITIPKHEPIKKVYVELVRQVVESEAGNEEDAE